MTSFKVTIDRVEGNLAVLLVREKESIQIDFPLSLLPVGSKEGDILAINIARDEKETENAKKRVSSLIEKLKNK
jgi:Protein of unknown function (DUF3006).